MEKVNLYLFTPGFFTDSKSIREVIDNGKRSVNQKDKSERNKEALFQAMLFNNLLKSVKGANNIALLQLSEVSMLNFVAYRIGKKEIYQTIKKKLEEIHFDGLDELLKDSFYAIKGETYFQLFTIQDRIRNKSEIDTIESNEFLYVAKKCYSYLLNRYLAGSIKIEGANTQKILLHYCEILGALSRYVEPFYLLSRLKSKTTKYKASIPLAEVVLLDAIFTKTCNSSNPLILIQIRESIKRARKEINTLDSRNLPLLAKIDDETRKLLEEYTDLNGVTQKEMKAMLHNGKKNYEKLNNYRKFISREHLFLNEHFLYCQCKIGTNDNLEIKSSCSHTENDKVFSYQLFLDKIKFEFDHARQAFYRATDPEGGKKVYKNTVQSITNNTEGIINSSQSSELISSFAKCFSILDKIAVNVNSVFSIVEKSKSNKIYFNSYFKRRDVKKVINGLEDNLYLIAMHSISQDLDKGNPLSEFAEYKDWRNSIEHNELYLVEDETDINNLHGKYPNADFFVGISEFKQKTLYLLHLCRSSIFTFTWVIRKASKKWDEKIK